MDAYDLSNDMKQLWADWVHRSSGTGEKLGSIKVCVNTVEGYSEVVRLHYNETLNMIELQLDEE